MYTYPLSQAQTQSMTFSNQCGMYSNFEPKTWLLRKLQLASQAFLGKFASLQMAQIICCTLSTQLLSFVPGYIM